MHDDTLHDSIASLACFLFHRTTLAGLIAHFVIKQRLDLLLITVVHACDTWLGTGCVISSMPLLSCCLFYCPWCECVCHEHIASHCRLHGLVQHCSYCSGSTAVRSSKARNMGHPFCIHCFNSCSNMMLVGDIHRCLGSLLLCEKTCRPCCMRFTT